MAPVYSLRSTISLRRTPEQPFFVRVSARQCFVLVGIEKQKTNGIHPAANASYNKGLSKCVVNLFDADNLRRMPQSKKPSAVGKREINENGCHCVAAAESAAESKVSVIVMFRKLSYVANICPFTKCTTA